MSLDLAEFWEQWGRDDAPRARLVKCPDGREFAQLRIDLGVLQMELDGRPDGTRCHGLATAVEYAEHELRCSRPLSDELWSDVEREFAQINYRRAALSQLADEMLSEKQDSATAQRLIARALRDIELLMRSLSLIRAERGEASEQAQHLPSLVFNRARLRTQLCVLEGRYEEAVEHATDGRRELALAIAERGGSGEEESDDPGIAYLGQLEQKVREQYGIQATLRERLETAIEREDFETAAALRDELRRRQSGARQLPTPQADPGS